MLKQLHVPSSTGYFTQEELEETPPTWNDGSKGELRVGEQLTSTQKEELSDLLNNVMQTLPGCTTLTTHTIDTGDAQPVQLPPIIFLKHIERQCNRNEGAWNH